MILFINKCFILYADNERYKEEGIRSASPAVFTSMPSKLERVGHS